MSATREEEEETTYSDSSTPNQQNDFAPKETSTPLTRNTTSTVSSTEASQETRRVPTRQQTRKTKKSQEKNEHEKEISNHFLPSVVDTDNPPPLKPPPRRRVPMTHSKLVKDLTLERLIQQDRLREQVEKQKIKDMVKKQFKKQIQKYKLKHGDSDSDSNDDSDQGLFVKPPKKSRSHISHDHHKETLQDSSHDYQSTPSQPRTMSNPYVNAIYPNLHQVRR